MDNTTYTTGWVPGPSTRSTLDIVWGSCFTIFLCTWSATCLNIPHPSATRLDVFRQKARWMFWGIVGPELVLSVALGQFASARRSVARMHALGYRRWTLRHAFYADMGGVVLRARDCRPFPVNARQLAFLLEKRYVDSGAQHPLAQLLESDADISDRSKADTLAKLLTLAQACWLAVQLCARAASRLPTSTLELSAAAIVFCSAVTFACWLRKPSDVLRGAFELRCSDGVDVARILVEAGDAAAVPYKHTPLDFVAKESFTFSYDVMGFVGLRCDDRDRPLKRFANDRFPDITPMEKAGLFIVTVAYSALHLIGWDFEFPSHTEQVLWRTASLVMTVTTVAFWGFETAAARYRFGRWDKYLLWFGLKRDGRSNTHAAPTETGLDCTLGGAAPRKGSSGSGASTVELALEGQTAFEAEQKSAKPLPMWEVALIMPVVLAYAAARAYMLVEMFVGLRCMPDGVYRAVEVAQMIPHW